MAVLAGFLKVLADSQHKARALTPAQQIHRCLIEMKQDSQEGSLEAWQRKRAGLEATLKGLEMDAVRDLEIHVEIARQELDLFLAASRKQLLQAQQARILATKNPLDEAEARRWQAESHRLIRESQALQDRLFLKTA